MDTTKIVVIFGPSGSGKTTILEHLTAQNDCRIVTTTTRLMRPGEKHGVDYYFVDRNEFREMVERNEFMEHTEYAGNFYGTTWKEIRRPTKKRIRFVVTDRAGVKSYKEKCEPDMIVFAVCIHADERTSRARMESRGDDSELIEKRIQHSKSTNEFDFCPSEADMVFDNREGLVSRQRLLGFFNDIVKILVDVK